MTLVLPRRQLLKGLIGLIASPAIVRAGNIMSVKVVPDFGIKKGELQIIASSINKGYSALEVFLNNVKQRVNKDFFIDHGLVTFLTEPFEGDDVLVSARYENERCLPIVGTQFNFDIFKGQKKFTIPRLGE